MNVFLKGFITLQGIKTDDKKITERAVHKNVLRGVFNKMLVAKAQRDLMVAVAYLTVSDSVDDCAAPGWPV